MKTQFSQVHYQLPRFLGGGIGKGKQEPHNYQGWAFLGLRAKKAAWEATMGDHQNRE